MTLSHGTPSHFLEVKNLNEHELIITYKDLVQFKSPNASNSCSNQCLEGNDFAHPQGKHAYGYFKNEL